MNKEFKMLPLDGKKSLENHVVNIDFKNQVIHLKSYKTVVAKYDFYNDKMIVTGYYSKTTMRHINNFLEYFDYPRISKKELENSVKHNSGILNK